MWVGTRLLDVPPPERGDLSNISTVRNVRGKESYCQWSPLPERDGLSLDLSVGSPRDGRDPFSGGVDGLRVHG